MPPVGTRLFATAALIMGTSLGLAPRSWAIPKLVIVESSDEKIGGGADDVTFNGNALGHTSNTTANFGFAFPNDLLGAYLDGVKQKSGSTCPDLIAGKKSGDCISFAASQVGGNTFVNGFASNAVDPPDKGDTETFSVTPAAGGPSVLNYEILSSCEPAKKLSPLGSDVEACPIPEPPALALLAPGLLALFWTRRQMG